MAVASNLHAIRGCCAPAFSSLDHDSRNAAKDRDPGLADVHGKIVTEKLFKCQKQGIADLPVVGEGCLHTRAAFGCYSLFKMRTGRDTRNAIKNLDAAGGATRKRSTLVVMWNSVLDRRLEQGLPVNHLDSEFMRVSDSMHCHGRKALNVSAKQALDVFRRSLRFHSEATCALNPFMDDVIAEDFYGYPLDQQTNWVHVVVLVSWR